MKCKIRNAKIRDANTLLKVPMSKNSYTTHAALSVLGPMSLTIERLPDGDWDVFCTPTDDNGPAVANSALVALNTGDEQLPEDLKPLVYFTVYMSMLKYAERKLREHYLPPEAGATVVHESEVPPDPKAKA